jgi:hypothetical protein
MPGLFHAPAARIGGMKLWRSLGGLFQICAGTAGLLLGLCLTAMTLCFGTVRLGELVLPLAIVVASVFVVRSGISHDWRNTGPK